VGRLLLKVGAPVIAVFEGRKKISLDGTEEERTGAPSVAENDGRPRLLNLSILSSPVKCNRNVDLGTFLLL
jgi:hypothetical protein